jgi:hypothetical protein
MGVNVIKTDFKTVRDGAEYNRLLQATAREGERGWGWRSEYRDEISGFVKESQFLDKLRCLLKRTLHSPHRAAS